MEWGKPRHIARNLNAEILGIALKERCQAMVNQYADNEINLAKLNKRWIKVRPLVNRAYRKKKLNPSEYVPNILVDETIRERLIT